MRGDEAQAREVAFGLERKIQGIWEKGLDSQLKSVLHEDRRSFSSHV